MLTIYITNTGSSINIYRHICRYRAANRWDIINNEQETLFIHPLDGEVFAKLTLEINTNFNVGISRCIFIIINLIEILTNVPTLTTLVLEENKYVFVYFLDLSSWTSRNAGHHIKVPTINFRPLLEVVW